MNQFRIFCQKRRVKAVVRVMVFLFFLIFFSLFLIQPSSAQTANSVSGFVFEDLNLNDILNPGEPKLADWRVNLYQKDELIQTKVTNGGGKYSFNNLGPGDYQIELEVPNTWTSITSSNVSVSLGTEERAKVDFANYQIIREERGMGPIMSVHTISAQSLSPTSIKINWFTNYQATSQVVFGSFSKLNSQLSLDDNFGYSFSSPVNFKTITYHSVILTDLRPETTYYYRVVSLPNPKQWRGASRIFSPEFSFTTGSLPAAEKAGMAEENEESEKQEGKILGTKEEEVLPTPIRQSPESKLTVTETTSTKDLAVEKSEEGKEPLMGLEAEAEEGTAATLPTKCTGYIWLLSILNLIAIIFVWQKGKKSKSISSQKLWWIIVILVAVPTILGYPECWLTIWLLIILILTIIYLSSSKKKPKTLSTPSSPPSSKPPKSPSTSPDSFKPSPPSLPSTPEGESLSQPSRPAPPDPSPSSEGKPSSSSPPIQLPFSSSSSSEPPPPPLPTEEPPPTRSQLPF